MFFCRFALVLCFFAHWLTVHAQNLVPNPGFEQLKKLPCRAVTDPIDNISNYASNWVSPTGGTSDIHLSVGPDSCPANSSKYGLLAHGGNVSAGIFTLVSPNRGLIPYREYLQTKLTQKLTIGKVYYVELYASPLDSKLASGISYYSNNIGCYFSVDSINKRLGATDQTSLLSFKPQINEARIMDKPREWHKISGCFTASEAAQYLTIGNFFDDAQTAYIELDQRRLATYFFIDDISVIETGLSTLPTVNINDTTLCPNQKLTLSLPKNAQISYKWQDGTVSSTYTIRQPGIYSVTATTGPCVVTDTFNVSQEKVVRLPADTVLCRGTTLVLDPDNPTANSLKWSDGSKGLTLRVSESGTYWVISESSTCLQTDYIQVQVADCPGYIPNVFTPNDDGKNDTFFIEGVSLSPWKLEVYNRWGSQVYKNEAYQNDWEGEGLPTGTYYYHLSSSLLNKRFKGWVHIMR